MFQRLAVGVPHAPRGKKEKVGAATECLDGNHPVEPNCGDWGAMRGWIIRQSCLRRYIVRINDIGLGPIHAESSGGFEFGLWKGFDLGGIKGSKGGCKIWPLLG